MAYKEYTLDDGQIIKIAKRKNNRSLKLSITTHGDVRVSIPSWTPYRAGLEFAKSKQDWIAAQIKPNVLLIEGQHIGKAHRLIFIQKGSSIISTRVSSGEVRITVPRGVNNDNPEVQAKANKASIKALRQESENLLPQRLKMLANKHDFTYRGVTIKQLRGRWGSCDSHKRIVLNLFLIQLPWNFIDYVLLHELTHTQVMKHGPDFWDKMESLVPNARKISKDLKKYQPVLNSQP